VSPPVEDSKHVREGQHDDGIVDDQQRSTRFDPSLEQPCRGEHAAYQHRQGEDMYNEGSDVKVRLRIVMSVLA
jgi:hypothetical protein